MAERKTITKRQEPVLTEEQKRNRQENIYLTKIGIMVFVTAVCVILFFFVLLRYQGFANIWKKLMNAASPIIMGLVIAYLLNPITGFVERKSYPLLLKCSKTENKAKRRARTVGVVLSMLFMIIVIALLIAAVVPSVIRSVMSLVDSVPGYVQDFIKMMESGTLGNFEATEIVGEYLTKATKYLQDWMQESLLPEAKNYLSQITSGVISVVKMLFNFIIGMIVAVYVLTIKEKLIGQSKKLLYAIFRVRVGNIIVETMHKADDIFGGFIIGKIIDSAIIGMICYIGCAILRIPDSMLVAVVVGVTNIIPVFGPFIGAVPSLLLVVIQSPIHALYLLVFVVILQQVDGNIIGPKILGSSTGLSTFWVMFAILVGGGLFGFLGMLLGVPVFALIYYIVRKLVNYGVRKKHLPEDTRAYVKAASVDEKTYQVILYPEAKK